ncbi:MAG TPA: methyltransferase domain-containing protein [Streptosporangiaceae bacterium]|nr:methyltransferase domain-containing protein [Streptosporangiaceae bacterium]
MTHACPHAAHDGAYPVPRHTPDSDGQAEILDLDAEVLAEHIASITAWLPIERAPRHIVDLGCGTGAGTFALLARFPEAEVTALDASAGHLRRLRERAEALGVADRVRTVPADLDADWPELGQPLATGQTGGGDVVGAQQQPVVPTQRGVQRRVVDGVGEIADIEEGSVLPQR